MTVYVRYNKPNVVKPPRYDRWFVDYLPITGNDKIKYYVDGEAYAADLYEALTGARQEICMTGLHFTGTFRLKRDPGSKWSASGDGKTLQEVLAAASKKVQVYLLVNQFWPNEGTIVRNYDRARRDLDRLLWKMPHPIAGVITESGGLWAYLPKTQEFFKYLKDNGNPANVHCYCDIHQGYIFHSNHQKTIVVDRKIGFFGGMDLTDIDGDRWDTPQHDPRDPRRNFDKPERNWHDVHMRVEKTDAKQAGAVDFVFANFLSRYCYGYLYLPSPPQNGEIKSTHQKTCDGIQTDGKGPRDYVPEKQWRYPEERTEAKLAAPVVQVVRSMPAGNWANYEYNQNPKWNRSEQKRFECSARHAYIKGIRAAEKLIYLENQWVADEHIWAALKETAKRRVTNADFRLVIVIPKKFLRAAGFGRQQDMNLDPHVKALVDIFTKAGCPEHFGLFSVLQPVAHVNESGNALAHWQVPECVWDYMYVHSKVLIVDDCWALAGSANAGGISLTGLGFQSEPDTELSAIVLDERKDASEVKRLRKRLWAEHLGLAEGDVDDYRKGVEQFHAQAKQQDYQGTSAKRVHYNVLYYPLSPKAAEGRTKGVWKHLKWQQIERQAKQRVQSPDDVHQTYHNLSGPLAVVHMLLERDSARYEKLVDDLYHSGKSADCRVNVFGEDLLATAIEAEHPILEVDWMVGGAMLDSTNWVLDYQGTVSETVASVCEDPQLAKIMERVLPCRGGTSLWDCMDRNPKARTPRSVFRDARRVSEYLLGQKPDQQGGKSCPTLFAAMKVLPRLFFERNEAAISADKKKADFDLGDPKYWISRASRDNPFLRLERDRRYPLYPGVLTPWDVKHIMPGWIWVRLLDPIAFHAQGDEIREVQFTCWTWGRRMVLKVPFRLFSETVQGFVVGYYTGEAKKRAEGAAKETSVTGEFLKAGQQKDYVHEDVHLTDVTVSCTSGALRVEIGRRVWYTWEVVRTADVGAGATFSHTVPSGTCDQDLRVRLNARQDSRYSMECKSRS